MNPSSNVSIDETSREVASHKYSFRKKVSFRSDDVLKLILEDAEYSNAKDEEKELEV